jgi:hypothetical protein
VTIGNSKWLAPEIICPPPHAINVVESKPADVYAFGMVVIEVFTLQPPFGDSSGARLLCKILDGHRPEIPSNAEAIGLTGPVQELLQKCWLKDPARRPTINGVVRWCEDLTGISQPLRRTPLKQSRPLSVPRPTPPLVTAGGLSTRSGKHAVPFPYITNSSVWRMTTCRHPKGNETVV